MGGGLGDSDYIGSRGSKLELRITLHRESGSKLPCSLWGLGRRP